MNWWKSIKDYFNKKKTTSKEIDEVKKEFEKEGVVKLTPLNEAVASGKVTVKETTPKRARKKGKFVSDNKSTPNVNEAWVGGKSPIKKKKPKAKFVKIKKKK